MENKIKSKRLLEEFPIPSYDQWLQLVEKQLNGVPFEKKLVNTTAEGISVEPIYLKGDVKGSNAFASLPGFFPYTRNTHPAGTVKNGWKISQQYTYPDISLLNEAIKQDVKMGLSSMMLTLDQAGKNGADPDNADPEKIGKAGLSICRQDDLEKAFEGVDLSDTNILLDVGSSTFSFFSLLVGYLQSTKISLKRLNGAAIFDPFADCLVQGKLNRSKDQLFDEMVGLVNWTSQNTPEFKIIGIDARPYAEAGGNAVQELAYSLSAAVEYLREIQQRGLTIDQAAGSMCMFLGIGADFFTEIAKLRAARSLWAKMIVAFGGSEEAQKLTIHSTSTQWNKTVHDPHVNMLRATTEAYSSVLGGCDSLNVAPFDEILGLPGETSRRISRNIQVILKDECHGNKVIDPAGGSWFVEEMTRELAEKAWSAFQEIEKEGGFLSALEKGQPQEQIKETASKRKDLVAKRKHVIVGTNMYPNLDETKPTTKEFDRQAFVTTRTEQVKKWKSSRENRSGWTSLKDMSFQSPEFFNQIIDSVNQGLTLGEINSILAKDNKGLRLSSFLTTGRLADDYEVLRKNADAFKEKNSTYPEVFFANMGPVKQHKPRAEFSAGFLQPAGFAVINNDGFNTVEDAANAALASNSRIVVICSTDETYPELVPSLTKLIKEQRPEICVLVAGLPKEHVDAFRDAGVDDFIHLKANNLSLLQNLQKRAGVSQ